MTDTDNGEDEPLTDTETAETVFPEEPLGSASAEIRLSAETHERLRDEYNQLVDEGYTDLFSTFALNHLRVDWKTHIDKE